jgi:hypothetical protein
MTEKEIFNIIETAFDEELFDIKDEASWVDAREKFIRKIKEKISSLFSGDLKSFEEINNINVNSLDKLNKWFINNCENFGELNNELLITGSEAKRLIVIILFDILQSIKSSNLDINKHKTESIIKRYLE